MERGPDSWYYNQIRVYNLRIPTNDLGPERHLTLLSDKLLNKVLQMITW